MKGKQQKTAEEYRMKASDFDAIMRRALDARPEEKPKKKARKARPKK